MKKSFLYLITLVLTISYSMTFIGCSKTSSKNQEGVFKYSKEAIKAVIMQTQKDFIDYVMIHNNNNNETYTTFKKFTEESLERFKNASLNSVSASEEMIRYLEGHLSKAQDLGGSDNKHYRQLFSETPTLAVCFVYDTRIVNWSYEKIVELMTNSSFREEFLKDCELG